jgi:hypothetical protein
MVSGNPQEMICPQCCGRSLAEPSGRPKVSNIVGDLRSAVSAGSETLAEHVAEFVRIRSQAGRSDMVSDLTGWQPVLRGFTGWQLCDGELANSAAGGN